MTPIVSVVMPVFNRASLVGEAIDSILGQTLGDLELIIVDDGSTDATPDIIADYARRDSRVRPHRIMRDGERLASGAHAANIGIARAEGAYYARMDSDDIAEPERLALQLSLTRGHDLDICGGQAVAFGEREKSIWYPQTHEAIRSELVFRPAMMNAVMFIRMAVMKSALYSETEAFEEYEFLTRMVFSAKMGNVPQAVHRFRQHDGSFSRIHRQQMLASIWKLRFSYFSRLFPSARFDDCRIMNAVGNEFPLDSAGKLKVAGDWLIRLSRVDEEKSRARMLRRWREACDIAQIDPAEVDAMRDPVSAQIMAPP